jgi:hypothetical protein
MSARFVAPPIKLFIGIFIISCCATSILFAQEEQEPKTSDPEAKPKDESQVPVDVKVRQLVLKYENEIAFFLPEGEFDAALEKKIGHFSAQTRVRYNFLRGEMGFSLQSNYTRFRIVPQIRVYDRLLFVPLLEPNRADRVWRREQGVQLGAHVFFIRPVNALTGFNYERFSFPSTINQQDLESQYVRSVSQSLGVRADSVRFSSFYNSGICELAIVHAFPYARSQTKFWQLQFFARGKAETAWISLIGEARVLALLDNGKGVPPSYLGGRNRLSAYDTNEFSGINLFYLSEVNRFHLNRQKSLQMTGGFSLFAVDLIMHTEAGQVGLDDRLRDFSSYHVSLGWGFNSVVGYRGRRAFEIFFTVYKALEPYRRFRYYFGFKF